MNECTALEDLHRAYGLQLKTFSRRAAGLMSMKWRVTLRKSSRFAANGTASAQHFVAADGTYSQSPKDTKCGGQPRGCSMVTLKCLDASCVRLRAISSSRLRKHINHCFNLSQTDSQRRTAIRVCHVLNYQKS